MSKIDYEKVLREKLGNDAFELLSSSEQEFSNWIDRGQWANRQCDVYARKFTETHQELKRVKEELRKVNTQLLNLSQPKARIGDVFYLITLPYYITGNPDDMYGNLDIFEVSVSRIIYEEDETIYYFKHTSTNEELLHSFTENTFNKTIFKQKTEAKERLDSMKTQVQGLCI